MLTPGTRIGAYEISGSLGAGGMGEVYKARDTRLDRTVALKLLPEEWAADPDRRARFEREARAVAALNHSHICALHDVGEAAPADAGVQASIRFLVMEHLEGQTLADRLLRGALPMADVLRYAIELADALDHAHRRGLVHRDLKPGNVMITESGTKLLDFGLSKQQSAPDLLALSTLAPDGDVQTAAGAVMGTYPYMPPEQLSGGEADARSDIFALGATIFEMATGRRAFEGKTAATVIGAVLHSDPPSVSSLQPATPSGLDRIVARALAKDPDDRWQTARDLLLELKWLAGDGVRRDPRRIYPTKGVVAVAGGALAMTALIAWFGVPYFRATPVDEAMVRRFSFAPPANLKRAEVRFGGPVTISPDGRQYVYVASGPDGKQLLWLHPLDAASPRALAGTEGAAYPFWSPDSRSIGFFADDRLKRIDADGGPVRTLSTAILPRGGTWSRSGEIVFAAGVGEELYRLPPGGAAAVVPADGINTYRLWPSFLPDGRHILYFGRREKPGIFVSSLDTHETKVLVAGLYMGVAYAPPGYLVFFNGGSMAGTLLAQRFDAGRRELIGEPVPLAENVPFYPNFGRADFSVSENGTLLYGAFADETSELVWFSRDGKRLGNVPGATGYTRAALSPDEKTIAADRLDPETQSQDVWLIETTRGATTRLTTNPGHDQMGKWSPDGHRIVYGSTREKEPNGTRVMTLSSGADERLFTPDVTAARRQITDWSSDGTLIIYGTTDPRRKWDLWAMSATPDPATGLRTHMPYLQSEFDEHQGRLSPDGKWLAYVSNQSGRPEVYVDAFPGKGARSQISNGGGYEPRWRTDGKELFYRSGRSLMALTVATVAGKATGTPRLLFDMPIDESGDQILREEAKYTVTRDGQRILVNAVRSEPALAPVTVLLNWPAGLDGPARSAD
ncbi:MAG TPA: protein kinase [Vicinamibacterales bacterium]|nr:protein kinase [Vicinamibacterales bacterium]